MNIEMESGWLGDFMDRKPSSEFLKKYLLENEKIKVLNVNSPWGSGKSFFLRRWYDDLKLEHACVFFNAWETDYSPEPLIALVTCIQLETQTPAGVVKKGVKAKAIDVGSVLIKNAVPLIAKGLVKKFVGVELDDLVEGASGDAADSAADIVKGLIKEQSRSKENVANFKTAVSDQLSSYAKARNLKSPAFIFIDELDRCRPTYAIELLERIKHFFELENCRFVVASDSVELAHSIRAVYGEKFSSERYLSRFFDAEFRLDNSNVLAMAKSLDADFPIMRLGVEVQGRLTPTADGRDGKPRPDTIWTHDQNYPEWALILAGMGRFFNIQLRELKRYSEQINSMASSLPNHSIHYFWAAFLVFCKAADNNLYKYISVAGKYVDAITGYERNEAVPVTFAFRDEHVSIGEIAKFYLRMLYSSSQEMQQVLISQQGWREMLARNFIHDREQIVSYRQLVELAHRLS